MCVGGGGGGGGGGVGVGGGGVFGLGMVLGSASSWTSAVVHELRPILVPSASSLTAEKCGLTQQSFTKPSWQALLCKHITALFLSVQ